MAQTLRLTAPTNLAEISCLDNALQLLHRRPGLGDLDPESTLWEEKAELLQELIGKGRAFHKLHAGHDKALIPEAWGTDVLEARRALLDVGNQWWRFVTPRFWRARSFVRALCKKDAPTTHQDRLAILDAISEARALAADLDAEATLLEEVLRSSWKRKRTQWKFVASSGEWCLRAHSDISNRSVPEDFLNALAADTSKATLAEHRDQLQELHASFADHLQPACESAAAPVEDRRDAGGARHDRERRTRH